MVRRAVVKRGRAEYGEAGSVLKSTEYVYNDKSINRQLEEK